MKLNVLAIIPARGGSKGLPGKNIKLLGGHPLIAWSIAAGLESEYVNKVIVSTDDRGIAEIANRYRAEVPFIRPAELAKDFSTDIEFLTHALNWLREQESYEPDWVVLLRPTSPLREIGLIDSCIEKAISVKGAECLRTVIPAPHTPYKMWKQEGDFLIPLLEAPEDIAEPFNAPRQSLPEVLWHVGVVDVIKTETILELHSASGTRIIPFRINEALAVDIDLASDFENAEKKLTEINNLVSPTVNKV